MVLKQVPSRGARLFTLACLLSGVFFGGHALHTYLSGGPGVYIIGAMANIVLAITMSVIFSAQVIIAIYFEEKGK